MKKKCRNISLSLLALLGLAACQAPIKPDTSVKYVFPTAAPLSYTFKMDVDANADAGFFQYKGKIGMDAIIELKNVMTNTPFGEKVQMNMKNLDVQSDDPRIKAGILMGMNYFRSYYAYLYLTAFGKLSVLYGSRVQPELSSYGAMIFPDFTDPDQVWSGSSQDTNFFINLQQQPYHITISKVDGPASMKDTFIMINRSYIYRLYEEKDYKESVDPQPFAVIKANFKILFDNTAGKIQSEDIDLDMRVSYPMKQGILSQNLVLNAKGKVAITAITEMLP